MAYLYGYLDRLTGAVGAGKTHGWAYDANGNRLVETGTAPSTFTPSGTSNQLNSVTGALARSYSYDAAGNATSDGTKTYGFDNRGRMVSVVDGFDNEGYVYSALG